MNLITGLSSQQLHRAADLKERIDALQHQLNTLLNGNGDTNGASNGAAAATRAGRKKRKLSPEGRERIAAAARNRWAKLRTIRQAAPAKKAKRHFSPEARARLAALAKARWAKAKVSGKSRL